MKDLSKKISEIESELSRFKDIRRLHNWTPEIDRILLKYIPTKGPAVVGSVLNVAESTVYGRYKKILGAGQPSPPIVGKQKKGKK